METTTPEPTTTAIKVNLAEPRLTVWRLLYKAAVFVAIALGVAYVGVPFLEHLAEKSRTVIVCAQGQDGQLVDCYPMD